MARWVRGVGTEPVGGPPASVEPPAHVADRAAWLRQALARAEQQAVDQPGGVGAQWARHAHQLRDALDVCEADDRRAAEARGRAEEPDPVVVARRLLRQLPLLARLAPSEAREIWLELGRGLGEWPE